MNRDEALKYACSIVDRVAKRYGWPIEMAVQDFKNNLGGYRGKDGDYCYGKQGFVVGRPSGMTSDHEDGSWVFGWPEIQRALYDNQMTFEL